MPDCPPTVASDPTSDPTTLVIIAVLVAIVVLDVWLYVRYRQSISRRFLSWSRARRWFRALLLTSLTLLAWHWVFGFPW